uniref:FG-GAP repeat domain-containing protein n=1 Tax=uncultured Nostoc sp. TaxID=340711 RepID=UPI0035CBF547
MPESTNSSPLSLNTSKWVSESFAKSQILTNSFEGLNYDLGFGNKSSSLALESEPVTAPVKTSANPNPNPYLTSAAITPDFNGDGKTDKVWVDSTTGEIIIRLMDGTNVLEQGSLGNFDISAYDYKIADFNADGKTDFLLRNKTTGENSIALIDGTKVANAASLTSVDPAWTPQIGDFNGD